MLHAWKAPRLIKGALTYVPWFNEVRRRRSATGGSGSARYCYAVWMRHLTIASGFGFRVTDASVGELGPGDTIGTGLAALLSGARRYVAVDAFPYAVKADLGTIFQPLAQMFLSREAIPDHHEFPGVRPTLDSYAFPENLIPRDVPARQIQQLEASVAAGIHAIGEVSYVAPWQPSDDIVPGTLDLLFSQAVLQYVDDLENTYRAMYRWLKPGAYCSHATGFGANDFSPHWNGHWAYRDWEWRIVRGRREFLLNRAPLSVHLELIRRIGFEILHLAVQEDRGGLSLSELSPRFRTLDPADRFARGAMMVLRKPC